jgi:hypothetical protein
MENRAIRTSPECTFFDTDEKLYETLKNFPENKPSFFKGISFETDQRKIDFRILLHGTSA